MDRSRRAVLTMLGVVATGLPKLALADDAILVFAAMTLKDALDRIAARYHAPDQGAGGPAMRISYGPTATLVKQLENGAAADLFFSADSDWMDYAADHQLIQPATRVDLLTSRLVLIAPKGTNTTASVISSATPIGQMLAGQRLALCDPAMMPAGRYGRAALQKLGLWSQVQDHIAMSDTVRSAVVNVGRQEAPLGIVFDTDAALDPQVQVVGVFPADSHPPIIYPVALTTHARPASAAFLQFLTGAEATAIFQSFGYRTAPS